MKLKSISITGMHKVTQKTYEFDGSVNYFIGPNGSGKSTILEAIQLALLGYIPGYAKTNESIMKHAQSNVLSVEAHIDDNGNNISIVRSWVKSGSSAKSSIDVNPATFDISSVLSDIEIPIFNFNDFKDMTANKLKEWFISFLPNQTDSIDWRTQLTECLGDRSTILKESVLNDVLEFIGNSSSEGVSLVKDVNSYLKEQQTFYKSQLTRLQQTVDSLIYYDDCEEIDEESANQEKSEINKLRDQLIQWEVTEKEVSRITNELAEIPLTADTWTSDPEIIRADKDKIDITAQIEEINKSAEAKNTEYIDLKSQYAELSGQIKMMNIQSDTCPYTSKKCDEMTAVAKKQQKKLAELQKQADSLYKKLNTIVAELNVIQAPLKDLQNKLTYCNQVESRVRSKYDRVEFLKSQLPTNVTDRPCTETREELADKLAAIDNKLAKSLANKQYNQLTEKVTQEKFNVENTLEVIKMWIKLTDANGMQTELMNKPFLDLESDMNKYLGNLFGDTQLTSKFNLSAKANSFSFGIVRNDKYIEFDYLSSGEKCIFTLALMMCILSRSDTAVKLILVDDLLDHLDESNADHLFETLCNVEDIQFILAGVQPCKLSNICKEV